MLKRVFSTEAQLSVCVKDADYPAFFAHSLEFNPPAHGVWNIVHVGMLIPEAHQIYVCASNCMRGVVLTAAEMGQSERFSMVLLKESDLLEGVAEDVTLEGVTNALLRLEKIPPVVMVFTVCTHRFLGCDFNYIYASLKERFPRVTFLRCFMEPVTQKEGLSPDQKLRKTIYDPLGPLPVREKSAVVLGCDFKQSPQSDFCRMLNAGGWSVSQVQDCKTYRDFLGLGAAEVFLSTFPRAHYGAHRTAERLGRPFFYLPGVFSYKENRALLMAFARALSLPEPDYGACEAACEEALSRAFSCVRDRPVAIDFSVHPRPLGLARLLLSHGFHVKKIYINAADEAEKEDFFWLKKNAPGLSLSSTLRPERRVAGRGPQDDVLAIGQIAAWCEGTSHFVNLTEGGDLWGYDGIRRMAGLIEDACLEKKDARDLIPRKGWGCASCF